MKADREEVRFIGESRFSSRVDDFMGCSLTLLGSFSWIEVMLDWSRFDEVDSDGLDRADAGCSLFKEYTDKDFSSSLTLRDFLKQNKIQSLV